MSALQSYLGPKEEPAVPIAISRMCCGNDRTQKLTQGVERFRGTEGRLGLTGLRQQGDAACYLRNVTSVRL